MSMCPDKAIISAYIDGEVYSPLKEKLEDHLSHCSVCKSVYTLYYSIHEQMQENIYDTDSFDSKHSFRLLLAKRIAVKNKHILKENKRPWLYASITVPIPLAAAAVLLFVLMPLLLLIKMEKTVQTESFSFTPITSLSPIQRQELGKVNFPLLQNKNTQDYLLPTGTIIHNRYKFNTADFLLPHKPNIYNDMFALPYYQIRIPVSDFRTHEETEEPSLFDNR